MSSTNKTSNLQLNSWIGSDKPKREDFNADNEIIDKAITQHIANSTVHISSREREAWNNYMYTGVYFGDGSIDRVITTDCPFQARIGFVFANNRPITIVRFGDEKKINYLGIFGIYANTLGIELNADNTSFTVKNSTSAMTADEYANFNEAGVTYHYIMLR